MFMVIGLIVLSSVVSAQGTRLWTKVAPGPASSGLYGVAYNPSNQRLYYLDYHATVIHISSSDDNLTYYGTIPAPTSDSNCTDIKYCTYDNTFWVLNNRLKMVFKINSSGTVLRSFSSPATDYPVGLGWDEATRTMYISDRRTAGGTFPAYIYVCDTSGNTIRRMDHPISAWFGPRCLVYKPRVGNVGPFLLNVYTFFNSSLLLDSAGVFALDPQTGRVLNYFRFLPNDTCNLRGIDIDPRDGNYFVGIFQYG